VYFRQYVLKAMQMRAKKELHLKRQGKNELNSKICGKMYNERD